MRKKLGEILIAVKVIRPEQLEQAEARPSPFHSRLPS